MVDNRYATALVIGSVLSLLATVYLSVAVGTQHWYQYSSPAVKHKASNATELKEDFINGDFSEMKYSSAMFRLNGTLGLWWRCIMVPGQSHWYETPDPKLETWCVSFTLPQQFTLKNRHPDDDSEKDMLRTYLWRCQFLLPLVSLALVFLSVHVGVCACLCRTFTPILGVGVLHLLAGLCSLGTVCCFLAGVDLLHQYSKPPDGVEGSLGWSLYLALISFPLQMMAAALFLWAARSHRKNYTRMTAYRLLEECCLSPSGSVTMAGSRVGLTPEPDNQVNLWSITPNGFIRYTLTSDLVLEVKGGNHYDKNQVILNKFDPNKLQQQWNLEII